MKTAREAALSEVSDLAIPKRRSWSWESSKSGSLTFVQGKLWSQNQAAQTQNGMAIGRKRARSG
jgi:hypothetical protein